MTQTGLGDNATLTDLRYAFYSGVNDGSIALNTTMRVDTSVGTRVFISDGVTERMISGRVSRKLTAPDYINGWAVDLAGLGIYLSRIDDLVTLEIPSRGLTGASATDNLWLALPLGFRKPLGIGNYGIFGYLVENSLPISLSFDRDNLSLSTRGMPNGMIQWRTTDAWPTTLPGTPA